MENFSENLRFLRDKKGLKQADMLGIIGFARTRWNNYEKGINMPSILDLEKICTFFEVSIDDILHSDLSKGNLISKTDNVKNTKKGNLKGNPIGNLKYETGGYSPPPQVLNEPPGEYRYECKNCAGYKEIISVKDALIASKEETIESLKVALNQALSRLNESSAGKK